VPCDLDGTKSIAWQVALDGRDGSNGSRGRIVPGGVAPSRVALCRVAPGRIEATKSCEFLIHPVS